VPGYLLCEQPFRLVLLHGYSGSGKSSLLHAGLFPRMKDIGPWQVLPPLRRSKSRGGLAEQLKTLLDTEVDPEDARPFKLCGDGFRYLFA